MFVYLCSWQCPLLCLDTNGLLRLVNIRLKKYPIPSPIFFQTQAHLWSGLWCVHMMTHRHVDCKHQDSNTTMALWLHCLPYTVALNQHTACSIHKKHVSIRGSFALKMIKWKNCDCTTENVMNKPVQSNGSSFASSQHHDCIKWPWEQQSSLLLQLGPATASQWWGNSKVCNHYRSFLRWQPGAWSWGCCSWGAAQYTQYTDQQLLSSSFPRRLFEASTAALLQGRSNGLLQAENLTCIHACPVTWRWKSSHT